MDKWNRWIYHQLCKGVPIIWSHPVSREDVECQFRDIEIRRLRAELAVRRSQFKTRFGCRPTDELLEEYINNLDAKSELRKLKKLLKGE